MWWRRALVPLKLSTAAGARMTQENQPELSVLLVSWNTRELTLACLRSLYEQTRRTSFEVLLVDNGSRDGSAEAVAREFPQVRLLAEKQNHGFAKANNMAAEEARGRYLLLLNTDTVVLDQAVDRLMDFAERQPAARIWGGRTLFPDGALNATSAWCRITAWSSFCMAVGLTTMIRRSRLFNPEAAADWGRDRELKVDIVSGCFFLIEAALWRDLKGFDRQFFMYGEEADLCARARAFGAQPMISPEATIIHYGGASATKRTDTIMYILGARIGLVRRHLSRGSGSIARLMMIFGSFWRFSLYRLVALVLRSERLRTAADQWSEVWQRRQEWKDGPPQRAL